MRCCLAILIVVWALVGSPTLCVAGVLTHDCAGDQSRRAAEPSWCVHEEAGCGHEDTCNHESDCGNDPCTDAVVRSNRQHDETVAGVLWLDVVKIQPQHRPSYGLPIRPRVNVTYLMQLLIPQSDIPLLI